MRDALGETPVIGLIPTQYKLDCHYSTHAFIVTEIHPSGAFNCSTLTGGKGGGHHIDSFDTFDPDKIAVGSLFYVTWLIKTSTGLPVYGLRPRLKLALGYGYTRDNTYE